MAIYVFNLLVNYFPNGVDRAQGYRARMLEGVSAPIWHVFTELPARREMDLYGRVGIDMDQMLSVHQYFTDNHTLRLSGKAEDKLEELSKFLQYTDVKRQEKSIRLKKDNNVAAEIFLDEHNRDYFHSVSYYCRGRLIRTEFYTSGIAYVNYYVTAKSDDRLYAKLTRRTFYNKDGSAAYDQIFEEKEEWYLFPDGRRRTKQQFISEFVKRLKLSEQDIVLLDRLASTDFAQPLFQFGYKAKFIAVIHSKHYFKKFEDPFRLYFNFEYYYLFKYSWRIDTIVVSTQRQREELEEKLREYKCIVPKIEVIPAGGIDQVRHPKMERRPYSLISVSRIDILKKIEWILRSVIKAHQVNPRISIDLYGEGDPTYFKSLTDLVSENQAQSYIRFMGQADVTEVYENYEVYLSASLGETLGLSVMEAIGSGNAVIGLDMEYGNRLLIHPGKNGYLVDFDLNYVSGDDSKLIDDMADKIIKIFENEERLNAFHQHSYEISKDFLAEKIKEKWKGLLFEK